MFWHDHLFALGYSQHRTLYSMGLHKNKILLTWMFGGKTKWKGTLTAVTVDVWVTFFEGKVKSQWFQGVQTVPNKVEQTYLNSAINFPKVMCSFPLSLTLTINWRKMRVQEYSPSISVGPCVVLFGIACSFDHHKRIARCDGGSCSAEKDGCSADFC